jgi:chromosomal replication initiator protein
MTKSEKLEEVWNRVLDALKDEILRSQYDGYVRQVRPIKHDGRKFFIAAPTQFVKEGIDKTLKKAIVKQLAAALGGPVDLFVQVEPSPRAAAPEPEPAPAREQSRANLNPKYRMEYYVVGGANRFAHAAALGVIKSPGEAYNPLFLWGPVGVGKTHLMQAIGHRLLDEDPKRKVMYVTAEVFTSECIDAIRHHTTQEFQRRYRTVDLLLIDDVQFFEQTQHMQEAFFPSCRSGS